MDHRSFHSLQQHDKYSIRNKPIEISIQNCVVKGDYNQSISLSALCTQLFHLGPQYNPSDFAALIFRTRTPTTLFFQRGNFVCAGAKTYFQVCWVILFLTNQIRYYVYRSIAVTHIASKNIVVTLKLQYHIDIVQLANENSACCTYDRSAFPGARYHPSTKPTTVDVYVDDGHGGSVLSSTATTTTTTGQPRVEQKIMALIFESGQIVVVGIKQWEYFKEFMVDFIPFIDRYIYDDHPSPQNIFMPISSINNPKNIPIGTTTNNTMNSKIQRQQTPLPTAIDLSTFFDSEVDTENEGVVSEDKGVVSEDKGVVSEDKGVVSEDIES